MMKIGIHLVAALVALVFPAGLSAQFSVYEASITDLQTALAEQRVTSVQLVEQYLLRIRAYDKRGPHLNAMIRLNPAALEVAARLDRERAAGRVRGPLHGIPVILKDNFDTADMPTSAGSLALAGSVPPDDAFQVARLRAAGGIILGKSNLHEMAMGITTISAFGGQTRNPYDVTRNPGGSSGGTGAAVAASYAAIGWGSDTCGSIRIPSAQNNLFGLRPTKGLSSIDGIVPLCHSQDVAGPLARTVRDLAIGLDATIGPDPSDPATAILTGKPLPRFVESLDPAALRGARLGVLTSGFGAAPEDAAAGEVVRAALSGMETAGATLIEIDIAGLDSVTEGSSLIAYEFKFDLLAYLQNTPGAAVQSMDDILSGGLYHDELGSRFRARNRVVSLDTDEYRAAVRRQGEVRRLLAEALATNNLDAIVYPTLRRPPALIGEIQRGSSCQLSASSGFPAMSVPAGFTPDGLPIGMEMLGGPLTDARLVSLAYAYEQLAGPRRAPEFTPPLRDGLAPAPESFGVTQTAAGVTLTGRFTFDANDGTLRYAVDLDGVAAADVFAIVLHRRDDAAGNGPAILRLAGPGSVQAAGDVMLSRRNREALRAGELFVRGYTRLQPAGVFHAILRM